MRVRYIVILFISILLSSCVSSTFITTTYSDDDIFVNGNFKGKGHAEIPQFGVPKKAHIEVKSNHELVGETFIRRKFNVFSLILVLWSYGLLYPVSAHYPGSIHVSSKKHSTTSEAGSIWDIPPSEINKSKWD